MEVRGKIVDLIRRRNRKVIVQVLEILIPGIVLERHVFRKQPADIINIGLLENIWYGRKKENSRLN